MKHGRGRSLIAWTMSLYLAVSLAGAEAAAAPDYLLLQTDTAGALLIDRNSIRRVDGVQQAWTLYRHDRLVPAAELIPEHLAMAARYLFDC